MILRNGAERGMGSLAVRSICFWEVASLVSFVGLGPGVFSQELSSFDTLYWLGLIPIFFTLSYPFDRYHSNDRCFDWSDKVNELA